MASNTDGLPAASATTDSEVPLWQATTTFKGSIKGARVSKLLSVRHALVTTGTTTLATTDFYVPCDPSGGIITFNPPASPLDLHELLIKDVAFAATIANYIILGGGFGSVDGVTGRKIVTAGGFFRLLYDAALTNKWIQV